MAFISSILASFEKVSVFSSRLYTKLELESMQLSGFIYSWL